MKSEAQNLKRVLIYTLQQIRIPEEYELDLWKLVLMKAMAHAKTTTTVHSPWTKKKKKKTQKEPENGPFSPIKMNYILNSGYVEFIKAARVCSTRACVCAITAL